jgi:XTP/dITP diphosphohydrolase
MNKVFKELNKKQKDWKTKKIRARFVCALTIFGPNQKTINSVGKIEGYISSSIKGKNGFGYDPIFIPKGKKLTFGEMKPNQKYNIDNRFKDFKNIKKFL